MGARREARERAISLAYESEQSGRPLADIIAELPRAPDDYAVTLATGVEAERDELDALLRKFSEHWKPERMPVVDRCILRLGTYELLHETDTPAAVVIAEAIELAQRYSTADSGRFVNGLLARIAAETRAGV